MGRDSSFALPLGLPFPETVDFALPILDLPDEGYCWRGKVDWLTAQNFVNGIGVCCLELFVEAVTRNKGM